MFTQHLKATVTKRWCLKQLNVFHCQKQMSKDKLSHQMCGKTIPTERSSSGKGTISKTWTFAVTIQC